MLELDIGILQKNQCLKGIAEGSIVPLKTVDGKDILVGKGCLVKVNVNIGVSDKGHIDVEIEKVKRLRDIGSYRPDIIMDLTIVDDYTIIDKLAPELSAPVGTLPHYRIYNQASQKEMQNIILTVAERQANRGVSFFTIHPTANFELANIAAKDRLVPITSRGGGIILRNMFRDGIKNPYEEILHEFVELCKDYNIAISVGSSFRPSCNKDALDRAHLKEIQLQIEYVQRIRELGGKVMFECLGHADLTQIDTYAELIKKSGIPMMALGPITTDIATGYDHITNAIGSSAMALKGGCHIINSVTREEHTGKVPNMDSIIEGIRAAKVSAHSVNIAKFPEYKRLTEHSAAEERAKKMSCVIDYGLFEDIDREKVSKACTRCGQQCPLLLTRKIGKYAKVKP